MKRLTILMAALAMLVAGFASQAAAAQPEIERIDLEFSFEDEFLTEECGFPVVGVAEGLIIVRTFDDGRALVELVTVNYTVTVSANGNEYALHNVGADQVRITPDGVAVLSVIGQVPFDFNGVLKINLDTEEVIHEPRHLRGDDVVEACAALAG